MVEDNFNFKVDNIESADLEDKSFRKPSVTQVSILYSVTVILFLLIGSKVQKREFYSGVLITEFLLVMLPALIMLSIYRYDIRKVLRLNGISLLNVFLVLCIMVFSIPLVNIFNLGNLLLIKYIFGKVIVYQPPVATGAGSLLLNMLVIGGSAGICEEILFRGTIQRGLERFGTAKAILLTALLFGLMHIDFQRLLGTFLLGSLIGFIVHRTNSIYSGMLAHFTNNSLAVLVAYGANKLSQAAKYSGIGGADSQYDVDKYFSGLLSLPPEQLAGVIIVWIFIILFCASILVGLGIALIKTTEGKVESTSREISEAGSRGILWLLPGLLITGFIYFAQGLALRGISIEWVNKILRLLGIK